jgi:DNA-binding MarR family transcriptional regulator
MDAAELARKAYLLAPSLSRILKDLEAAKYLRRRPGDSDSRQSLLSLSPKGSAMVTRVAPFLDGIHREIARRFGRERVDELLALLDELERALAEPPNERRAAQIKSGMNQP